MSPTDQVLRRLRESDPPGSGALGDGLRDAGVRFAAIGGPLEERWTRAVEELTECIRPIAGGAPVLNEGGVYRGSWIESTGTISTEVLARFAPAVARATLELFAAHQRDDGMIPYKITDAGPGFSQIQIVSPLARTVWHAHLLGAIDRSLLEVLYGTMERYDAWLARYRDTRGTGGVEAFCTFDTGHDLSPRFWFVPDRGYLSDARRYDPASPVLPYIAPDLTANVACQRAYLALIAEELGRDPQPWRDRAARSREALAAQCYDEADGIHYDRDATGEPVRVQSDVMLRVLACEIGDADFATRSLERYLMNTRKFLGHYGFTSLAMDDPRFDHDHTRNSWGGPSNLLSLIRAPHAFEHHGHVAELGVTAMPVLAALAAADRFPQCLDPWSGDAGFTSVYSPSILWFLDAIERHTGILPRPDGRVWLSGLTPTRLDHGVAPTAVGYSRKSDGALLELVGDDERIVVHRDGREWASFPRGWRLVVAGGRVESVIGLAGAPVRGRLEVGETFLDLEVAPNERIDVASSTADALAVSGRTTPGFVAPHA